MNNRIRVAVLIFEKDKILLIEHVNPKTGFTCWVPPGGGLKETENIFECAKREAWEETNLDVNVDKVVYLRQFIDHEGKKNHIEIFTLAKKHKDKLTIDNLKGMGGDEHFIKEARFFSKEEMKNKIVFPEIIKNDMWNDYRKGFPGIKFLGTQDTSEKRNI